jgi:hypothetical protein
MKIVYIATGAANMYKDHAMILSKALEMAGFEATVIADVTGEELFRQIRADRRPRNTYTLLATADASDERRTLGASLVLLTLSLQTRSRPSVH